MRMHERRVFADRPDLLVVEQDEQRNFACDTCPTRKDTETKRLGDLLYAK